MIILAHPPVQRLEIPDINRITPQANVLECVKSGNAGAACIIFFFAVIYASK